MTIIDTPEGISNWRFMSAVSQLSLELSTGTNFYGSRGSVYGPIRRDYIPGLPERATKRNKLIALATLLEGQPAGPVVDRARATLAEVLDAAGLVLTQV